MNKKNNKGFSLVELIVVIAIMAVLVGVLAPSLLRYVEKARLQKDNSAISEIAEAAKVACAQENINSEVAAISAGVTITASAGTFTITGENAPLLRAELQATVGSTVVCASNTYKKATNQPSLTIKVDASGNVSVVGTNIIETVGGTAASDGKTY